MVQLSHPYMTTGKTIALTRRTFVGKVTSLFFNMLCRLVITFLPRSKSLLIFWLQSPSAVISEPPKMKSATVSTVSPSISHEVMGPDAMIFFFWMLSCESAALNMPETLENWAVPTGLEKVSFHSNLKERQCQRMLKLLHNCTHLTC